MSPAVRPAGASPKTIELTCSFADGSAAEWAAELAVALPEARVRAWAPGHPPSDYAVVWKPTQAFVDAQPKLRAIFNAGAGVDALAGLQLPATLPVVRLEDAGLAEQMVDYVVHAVLHHYREFDVYAEQAAAGAWGPRPPRRKSAYPVGVLGHGVLGQAVARALSLAGFDVVAWARTAKLDAGVRVYAGDAQRDDFFRAVRVVVCLLPLTPATHHILDASAFSALRRGAIVVNVARGGHLDLGALLAALEDGRVAGATLDVFEDEPLPPTHPVWHHPRVRVTPHVSAATLRPEAIAQIAAKLRALRRGEAVTGIVASTTGY